MRRPPRNRPPVRAPLTASDARPRHRAPWRTSDAKNMAREVTKTLIEIVRECGGKTEDEAATYVKDLRTASRYVEDVWS